MNMKMKFCSFITLIIIQLKLASSILVESTGRKDKYCFYKHIDFGVIIHLSYIVTGESENIHLR
jgi:hypothetical protein